MLNISKLLTHNKFSSDTDFLEEHLPDQDFDDFNDLVSYLEGDHGYLCDAVSEYADSNTSIYYSDIEEYAKNNYDRFNDKISEFGWDGCGQDLHKASQLAEYCEIQENVNADIQKFIKFIKDTYNF